MAYLCCRLCCMSSRWRRRGGGSGGEDQIIRKREKSSETFSSGCKVNAVPRWQSVLSACTLPPSRGGPAVTPGANQVGLELDEINLATNGNKPRLHFTGASAWLITPSGGALATLNVWGLLTPLITAKSWQACWDVVPPTRWPILNKRAPSVLSITAAEGKKTSWCSSRGLGNEPSKVKLEVESRIEYMELHTDADESLKGKQNPNKWVQAWWFLC